MRRRFAIPFCIAALGVVLLATNVFSAGSGPNTKTFEYSFAIWGDFPYNDIQATTGVPNLIADINASDIEFSVHDGDLKAGSGVAGSKTPSMCDSALYAEALVYLNTFTKPAMFTPGDNDWTDCD